MLPRVQIAPGNLCRGGGFSSNGWTGSQAVLVELAVDLGAPRLAAVALTHSLTYPGEKSNNVLQASSNSLLETAAS